MALQIFVAPLDQVDQESDHRIVDPHAIERNNTDVLPVRVPKDFWEGRDSFDAPSLDANEIL